MMSRYGDHCYMLLPTICMLNAYSSIKGSYWCHYFPSFACISLKKYMMDYAELSAYSPQWLYRQKTDQYPQSLMNFLQPRWERLSMIWSVWNQVQSRTSRFFIGYLTQPRERLSLCGYRIQVFYSGFGNLLKTSLLFHSYFSSYLLLKGQKMTWLVRNLKGATELLFIFYDK